MLFSPEAVLASYRPDEVEFAAMKRVVWSALLIVLIGASPTHAVAQSSVCYAMTRGESATHAARRVTGNGENAYQQWFQIMDPSSRFVPKSQYNRIGAGRRACVIKSVIRSVSSNANHVEERKAAIVSGAPKGSGAAAALPAPTQLTRAKAGVRTQRASFDSLRSFGGIDLTMLWLCAAMVVPWFGWQIVDDYLARRQTASILVQCFVQRFVDEFERPLVRSDIGERALRSRLRLGVRRGRFSILLAPGEGRVYPNLADHKKNVEYDVDRVMRVIADHSFVSGAPYTKAGWIVVPFQFTA
jgi:hypothetical protein